MSEGAMMELENYIEAVRTEKSIGQSQRELALAEIGFDDLKKQALDELNWIDEHKRFMESSSVAAHVRSMEESSVMGLVRRMLDDSPAAVLKKFADEKASLMTCDRFGMPLN